MRTIAERGVTGSTAWAPPVSSWLKLHFYRFGISGYWSVGHKCWCYSITETVIVSLFAIGATLAVPALSRFCLGYGSFETWWKKVTPSQASSTAEEMPIKEETFIWLRNFLEDGRFYCRISRICQWKSEILIIKQSLPFQTCRMG